MSDLLRDAAERGIRYRDSINERDVRPSPDSPKLVESFGGPLPDGPSDASAVIGLLDDAGSPATMGMAGPRFFGFVIGGSLPVSVAANWLATAWDQNTGFYDITPAAAEVEAVSLRWLLDILHLPAESAGAFVTGATMANFTALAAARHAQYARAGWDVEAQGLIGAPPLDVYVSAEAHPTVRKALALLGLGRERVIVLPVDAQGRIDVGSLPELNAPSLVCVQAGNINTGAFDPFDAICDWAQRADAWVHVDGAFGLWAGAVPERRHLVAGCERADSWATDAHKWLNVPYDSGVAFVRDEEALRRAMSLSAAYLAFGEKRDPSSYTPELSRRARGVEVWAVLRALGRSGVAEMIDRCCRHATRFAEGLRKAGYEVLNDVTLNQVLVSFGTPEQTQRTIAAIQEDGTCWCGGTVWQGRTAMRISVSSWATTEDDVERSLEAMLRCARESGG